MKIQFAMSLALVTSIFGNGGELNPDTLYETCSKIEQNPHVRLVRNVLTQNSLEAVSKNWDCLRNREYIFSHEVKPCLSITDQLTSGRCWLFAGLNVLRVHYARALELSNFEFSQSYLYFYDKIERANYFLEKMIETSNLPLEARQVQYYMSISNTDGGDWANFAHLVNKYGLVPKKVYGENAACAESSQMNKILKLKLREFGNTIRDFLQEGGSVEEARKQKEKMLRDICTILIVHMGTPPKTFTWRYYDNQGEKKVLANTTPLEFLKHCEIDPVSDYVTLWSIPHAKIHLKKKFYEVDSTPICEASNSEYVNIEMQDMKEITRTAIENGEPIFFSADIGSDIDLDRGIMSPNLYEYSLLYQMDFPLTKQNKLALRCSSPNHAMVLSGVHIEDDIPQYWKVENSWGPVVGRGGIMMMLDSWFDEYVYQVVVPKKLVSDKVLQLFEQPAEEILPWEVW